MKKVIVIMLFSLAMLFLKFTAQAEDVTKVPIDETDILTESSDFKKIKELEDEMLRRMRSMYDGEDLPSDFPKKIDYSQAVKIYINTEIQELETNKEVEIVDLLKQSNYVWVIPIKISEENFKIIVAKGLALNKNNVYLLTEGEQQKILENEGKWSISSVSRGVGEAYLSYLADNSAIEGDCDKVVIIGGIPGMHEPVALGFAYGKAESWYSLGFSYPIIESMKSSSRLKIRKGIDSGKYDFESVMKASQSYVINDGDTTSGGAGGSIVEEYTSLYFITVPVVIISIIVAGTYFLYFRRNRKE